MKGRCRPDALGLRFAQRPADGKASPAVSATLIGHGVLLSGHDAPSAGRLPAEQMRAYERMDRVVGWACPTERIFKSPLREHAPGLTQLKRPSIDAVEQCLVELAYVLAFHAQQYSTR